MDRLTKQITLGYAYHVSDTIKSSTVAQLFWALDRFDFDGQEIDEGGREQRRHAIQACAAELDARNIPLRNPALPITFPREFPGEPPFINL